MDVPETDWPPGLTKIAYYRCPHWLRGDAVQAAWVEHLEGGKPDTAVRRLVRREIRQAAVHFEPPMVRRVLMVF